MAGSEAGSGAGAEAGSVHMLGGENDGSIASLGQLLHEPLVKLWDRRSGEGGGQVNRGSDRVGRRRVRVARGYGSIVKCCIYYWVIKYKSVYRRRLQSCHMSVEG